MFTSSLKITIYILLFSFLISCSETKQTRIFDVHIHGDEAPEKKLRHLEVNGVYSVAVSTSWPQQLSFQSGKEIKVLQGLFVPCPNGIVPYSQQKCFEDGREWPPVDWLEQQIKAKKIDFIGEVLTQYFGISSSDTLMYPYYALAEKYDLPVGIHTGSAGPNHGCPDFKEEMGNPLLLKNALARFPKMRVWLMHGGAPFVTEFIEVMKTTPGLYADISVLNNPQIIPPAQFDSLMKLYIDAGFEDRLMFGSDDADIKITTAAVDGLSFLTALQKEKIFYKNAETFFNYEP